MRSLSHPRTRHRLNQRAPCPAEIPREVSDEASRVVIGRYHATLVTCGFALLGLPTRGFDRLHTAEVRGSSPFAPTTHVSSRWRGARTWPRGGADRRDVPRLSCVGATPCPGTWADDDPKARALHTLLELSQYGVLLLDERLRIAWVSNAGAASLRYRADEVIGQRAADFLDPDQSPGVLERAGELLQDVRDETPGWQLGVRVRIRCGDGVARDFEFGGWAAESHGRSELLLVFLDVSERARVEDVLMSITEHDLDGALGQFVELASTQLRAPVGIALHPSLGGATYATPGARPTLFDDLTSSGADVTVRPIESSSGTVVGWLTVDLPQMTAWGAETMDRLVSLLGLVLAHQARMTDLLDAAATDPLTGLSNRRTLDLSLLAAEATAAHGWALLYCDLDRFKSINDDHGHDAGDAVLRAVSDRLRQAVRSADVIARLGGDEFVVLAQADRSQAEHLQARVRTHLAPPIVDGLGRFDVGVSVGLATATTAEGVRELLSTADAAMRRDKAQRRATR